MRKVFVVTFLAAPLTIATLCSSGSSQAQTSTVEKHAASIQAGEGIYTQKCHQCHAVFEGQFSFGPNLYGEMKKPHPKKSAAEVRVIIKNGKGKMPSFDGKLTEQETDDLLAYIHTL